MVNNNLKGDKYVLGSQAVAAIPRTGHRMITGGFTAEFDDFTLYDRYTAPTEGIIQMAGVSDVTLGTVNNYTTDIYIPRAKFTGTTPTVGGPDLMEHEMTFEGMYDIDNSKDDMRITLSDSDALGNWN